MSISKSYLVLVAISAILSISMAQSQSNPLILITEQKYIQRQISHKAVTSMKDINEMAKSLQNVKALAVDAQNLEAFVRQLKQIVSEMEISKEQISSLMISEGEIKKLQNITFEQIKDIESVKEALKQDNLDVLLHLNSNKQGRLLQAVPQSVGSQKPTTSSLFLNMDSVTLTGLLVSLFLVIILLIAINCLYQVKTNDQFGRTNLWVGKES